MRGVESWRPGLYQEASNNRKNLPDNYRDERLNAALVRQAHQEAAAQDVPCAA